MDKEVFAYMTRTIYYNEEYREFGYLTLNKLGVVDNLILRVKPCFSAPGNDTQVA